MKSPLRNYLYFSRQQRRGVWLLCLLIVLVLSGKVVYHHYFPHTGSTLADDSTPKDSLRQAYRTLQDSSRHRKRPWKRTYERRDRTNHTPPPLTPFPFNPNTADSATLRRLGLPGWMARNVVRYRENGGQFRQAKDFRKIYGLTEEQYNTLQPHIQIPAEPEKQHDTLRSLWLRTDSTKRAFKYPAGTVIELNRADTTELKKIPGIGSGIARLIVGRRQLLGGFHHIEQLEEINLDYEQLRPWFRIDTTAIRRINLNRAGIERLRNHPYLNFYQAKAIVEWRKKNGRLTSLKPFLLYEEFTEADFQRLAPYVCFE